MAQAHTPAKNHESAKHVEDRHEIAKTDLEPESEQDLTIGEIQRRASDEYWADPVGARKKDTEAREAAVAAETAKKK